MFIAFIVLSFHNCIHIGKLTKLYTLNIWQLYANKDVFKSFLFYLFLRKKDHEWRLQQENKQQQKIILYFLKHTQSVMF